MPTAIGVDLDEVRPDCTRVVGARAWVADTSVQRPTADRLKRLVAVIERVHNLGDLAASLNLPNRCLRNLKVRVVRECVKRPIWIALVRVRLRYPNAN